MPFVVGSEILTEPCTMSLSLSGPHAPSPSAEQLLFDVLPHLLQICIGQPHTTLELSRT